jgi:hypothetical protein
MMDDVTMAESSAVGRICGIRLLEAMRHHGDSRRILTRLQIDPVHQAGEMCRRVGVQSESSPLGSAMGLNSHARLMQRWLFLLLARALVSASAAVAVQAARVFVRASRR